MGYTLKVEGIEELSKKLTALGDKAGAVASQALYAGAGVVADAYSAACAGIKAEEFHYVYNGYQRKTSYEEKAALLGKTGIAKFEKTGAEVLTSIGLSGKLGYVEIAGKRIAVRLLGNAINKGTYFRVADKAFRNAVNKAKNPASAAIVSKADELIEEIMK